jgi:iron complex outermembrane receptor protein
MKKLIIFFYLFTLSGFSQKIAIDSMKIENLEEVLVSSVRVKNNIPIAYNNISKKEISNRNLGQDLPILLNFLPNVVTTSDAGAGIGYTGIRIRGINSQSTNVTINGIPYNDAESLGTFWVDLPDFSSSIENLQVQRGIGTSVNGSSAFGASINILTDKISNDPYFENSNSIGSYNTLKNTFRFSTGLINEQFEFSGRLSKIDSDGYIDRASSDLKSYFFQLSYKKNKTLVKFLNFGGHEITYQAWNGIDQETLEIDRTFNPSGLYYDINGEIRFHENEVDNYKQDHFQLHWSEIINNRITSNLGINLTNGLGYYEQYNENNNQDYITRKWLDNQFLVFNYSLEYKYKKNNIIFGTTYSKYDGDHFGETIWAQNSDDIEFNDLFYNGNGLKKDFSNFLKYIYQFSDEITIYGDLQLRNIKYKTIGSSSNLEDFSIDKSYSFFNPKAGLNFELNKKNRLYFSISKAFREPTRSDFESNPEIKPEELVDIELGWNYKLEGILINANWYYMKYKNQLVLTGEIDDVGAPIRENSGQSYRRGLEIESLLNLSNKITINANMSLSENKNVNYITSFNGEIVNLGNTQISFSPKLVSSIGFSFTPTNKLYLALITKHIGDQFMSNTDSNLSKLDSYTISDFNIVYKLKKTKLFDEITISAIINNLLNIDYVSNGYYYTYDDTWTDPNQAVTYEGVGYYPQATRNYLLGITFKF